MKKLSLIFSLVFITEASFAAVNSNSKISVTGWGTTSVPNINMEKTSGFSADNFAIKKYKVDVGKSKTHSGDSVIAFVAVKVVPNGGCFQPVDLHCEHKNGDSFNSYMAVFDAANAPGAGCTWLCADGYAGEGCSEKADGTAKVEWWGLNSSVRNSLGFPGGEEEIYEDVKKIANEIQTVPLFDVKISQKSNETYSAYTFLGITDYLTKGTKASPIVFSCKGGRSSMWVGFKGVNGYTSKIGTTKLLCPMGYGPNTDKTDCVEIVAPNSSSSTNSSNNSSSNSSNDSGNSSNSSTKDNDTTTSTGTVREIAIDGSVQEYSDTKQISQIDALKAQAGYDPAIHSVYDYNQSSTNPKFAIFCKDSSTGLESPDSLKCIECTPNLRRGVCLLNNPGFGVCSQCGTGKVYNPDTCRCENAAAHTMTDLAYGKGNSPKSGLLNVCWAMEDSERYKECVGVGTKPKTTSSNGNTNSSNNNSNNNSNAGNSNNNNSSNNTGSNDTKTPIKTTPVEPIKSIVIDDNTGIKGGSKLIEGKPDLLNGKLGGSITQLKKV